MLINIENMFKYIILFFLCIYIYSCSETNDETYIYHPTKENLDRDVTFVLSNSSSNDNLEKSQLKKKLDGREFHTSIGSLSEIESEMFSDIFQVEMTDREILIFERGNFRISRFDFQGNYISDFQATGRGPNEVQQIIKISVSDDMLYILDGVDVKFMDLTQPDSPVETFYRSDNTAIEDMCSLNDKFLLRYFSSPSSSGPQDSAIFHLFNTESEEIETSFGQPYEANSPNWSQILTEGSVICNEITDTVISTKSILPYIVAHNNEGMMKWVAEVEDFKPIIQRQHNVPGGSLRFRWHEDSFTHTTIQLLNYKESVIVQVSTFENFLNENDQFQNDEISIDTYIINSDTGERDYLGNNIPRILGMNEQYLITETDEEFPAIEVYRI